MKKLITAAVAASALVVLTACGSATSPSSNSTGGTSAGKFLGCMVTDTGGIDDKSFNASSWQGMQQAAAANSNVSVKYLQSTTSADYAKNITTFLSEKCGIIVTVGFLMGPATQTAAKANPKQKFAIVDFQAPQTNIDSLVYNTVEDGFLGGYLAAGMSKTGKVATFGGENFGTVTIYMDGFWDGVQYYNTQHHTNVVVLGWNEQTQSGEFANSFTNLTAGQTITQQFIQEGADVIFPVAGGVGLGAAKAVQDYDTTAGSQKVNMMWVDTDGCVSAAQYCQYFITSVEKGIQSSVKAAVLAAASGTFKGGAYVGTLANGGAALAPFHDFASKVPASLQSELNTVKQDIENGTIKPVTKNPA